LQAIQVRPHPADADKWMIVDGERRYRGALRAKLSTIPATITLEVEDAGDRIIRQLVRNEGKPLTPVEEALAFKKIIESKHAAGDKKYGVVQLARDLGIAKSTVSDRLTLTEIPAFWLELIVKGPLQLSHAPILHRWRKVPEKYQQRALEQMKNDYRWPSHSANGYKKVKAGDRLYVGDFQTLVRTFMTKFVKPVGDCPGYKGPTEAFAIDSYVGKRTYAMDPSQWQPIYRKGLAARKAKAAKRNGGDAGDRHTAWERQNRKYEEQRQRAEEERKRWQSAAPALLEAAAKLVGTASIAQLQRIVLAGVHRYNALSKRAGSLIPPGTTADSLVRSLALCELAGNLSNAWNDGKEFRAAVKPLGLDVDALLEKPKTAAASPDPAVREKHIHKPVTLEPELEEATV
jgi:ParB/RepB/Spo0J family partition protein